MHQKPENENRFRDVRGFVTFRLARTQNRLNAQATALLKKHTDLSLTEWRIISLIQLTGTTTASHISREAQMDKGQISRAVKPMIDKGLISQETHHQDNRQSMLSLTEAGKALHARNVGIMRKRQQDLTRNVPTGELEVFFKVLDQIYENTDMPDT